MSYYLRLSTIWDPEQLQKPSTIALRIAGADWYVVSGVSAVVPWFVVTLRAEMNSGNKKMADSGIFRKTEVTGVLAACLCRRGVTGGQ